MILRPVPTLLLRAPLLPVRALRDPTDALTRHPLGAGALELASPELRAALARGGGAQARASLARYARRAAFRPTPAGLFAGVAVAGLGAHTRVCTRGASGVLAPGWAAMAALGRALLDDPALRPHVRVRNCPSLLVSQGEAVWLAMGADGPAVDSAMLDELLAPLLQTAQNWVPWPSLRAVVADAQLELGHAGDDDAGDETSADELLLLLLDRGLLRHDLEPPLVGSPPASWMQRRLRAFPEEPSVAEALAPVRSVLQEAMTAQGVPELRTALRRLPGADATPPVNGVLRLETTGEPTLSSVAVERAAALSTWLFRLQEAMSPPVSERVLDGELLDALDQVAETYGAGALSMPAVALGDYGVRLIETAGEASSGSAETTLLAHLAGKLAQAERERVMQIELDPAELDQLLPASGTPPSFELFLMPAREPPRAPAGTGWLLGAHAPAGASMGRFAAALGKPLLRGLRELAALESAARPAQHVLDVAYAPSPALADLCAHPPVRQTALAIAGWPEGDAVTPADLELVVGTAGPQSPALRLAHDGTPVDPSPLHRVRSSTVPPGLLRLLAGWSFARQHTPWAFGWGPLAVVERLPRVVMDGFVLAPASWRIPSREQLLSRGGLARWRRALDVPETVQVGEGDELLFVDLRAREAAVELTRYAGGRAWEIWPPLDRLVDQGGRRVEAVVAVVTVPEQDEADALDSVLTGIRTAGRVPPPAEAAPAAGWTTHRLYGAEERQSVVLLHAVAPAVSEALAAREIDAWFFLPYVEPGSGRPHLRVRAHAAKPRGAQAFERRLRRWLQPLRSSGDVTVVETSDYFRESARYGGEQLMLAVERLFQGSSELALSALQVEEDEATAPLDPRVLLVRGADALASGLGLSLPERRQLAARLAASAMPSPGDELRGQHRALARELVELVGGSVKDVLSPALASLSRVPDAWPGDQREALRPALPALLHVQAVRLAGPRREHEVAALFFWERTLSSIEARRRQQQNR